MSLHISYLCYWGLKLKNYPVLGVKRKSRKRSLTAGKYFGCSSYYLSLGPMSSWSDMSIFIKCFSGPSMAKTGVRKGFDYTEDTWIIDFCSWNCLGESPHYLKFFCMLIVEHYTIKYFFLFVLNLLGWHWFMLLQLERKTRKIDYLNLKSQMIKRLSLSRFNHQILSSFHHLWQKQVSEKMFSFGHGDGNEDE